MRKGHGEKIFISHNKSACKAKCGLFIKKINIGRLPVCL